MDRGRTLVSHRGRQQANPGQKFIVHRAGDRSGLEWNRAAEPQAIAAVSRRATASPSWLHASLDGGAAASGAALLSVACSVAAIQKFSARKRLALERR